MTGRSKGLRRPRQAGPRSFCAVLSAGVAASLCLAAPQETARAADALTPPELAEVVSRKGLDRFVTADRLPDPASPALAGGKAVWAENCQNCHGGDQHSGAPKITSAKDWEPRIAKGLPALFSNAKSGFLGPTYKEMPARGGNRDLTDAEVEAAVAFMVWSSGGAGEVARWLSEPGN